MERKISLKNLYVIRVGTQIPYDNGKMIKFVPSQLTFARKEKKEYIDVLFGNKYYSFGDRHVDDWQICCAPIQPISNILQYVENGEKIIQKGYILRKNLLKLYHDLNTDEEKEEKEQEPQELVLDNLLTEKEKIEQLDSEITNLLSSAFTLMEQRKNFVSESYHKVEINEDMFFIKVENHKEINPIFIPYLAFINLMYYDFTNVKVDGIDFSNSNVVFNPQLVYQKNMSNCVYPENNFLFADFRGVNLKNTTFIVDNFGFHLSITGAITDTETRFCKKNGTLEFIKKTIS